MLTASLSNNLTRSPARVVFSVFWKHISYWLKAGVRHWLVLEVMPSVEVGKETATHGSWGGAFTESRRQWWESFGLCPEIYHCSFLVLALVVLTLSSTAFSLTLVFLSCFNSKLWKHRPSSNPQWFLDCIQPQCSISQPLKCKICFPVTARRSKSELCTDNEQSWWKHGTEKEEKVPGEAIAAYAPPSIPTTHGTTEVEMKVMTV